MDLSLFYTTFILFTLLSIADPFQFYDQCPTSRRLLLFGGFNSPTKEKKSHSISSSSSTSPAKYARSSDSNSLTVYIRPQTSAELGRKVRSYTHLLKSKLYTNEEKAEYKRLKNEKKKQKKFSIQNKSSISSKSQELIVVDDDELNRCRALLHIDSPLITEEKSSKPKKTKSITSKIKNVTQQTVKRIKEISTATTTSSSTINDKKTKKSNSKNVSKSLINKTNIDQSSISANDRLTESSESTSKTKTKQEKSEIKTPVEPIDKNVEKNNSVVGRAFHFVKNMFQLSDDFYINNQTENDKQNHHSSRKLLSFDDEKNNFQNEPLMETFDDLSFYATSLSKRQLLSVKTKKSKKSPKTKDKTVVNADTNKPKVGWAYRYRISRYLAAQKMKRTGNKTKKPSKNLNEKLSKRKLLQYENDQDFNSDNDEISDQDIINSVKITQQFIPKRHLSISRNKYQQEEDHNNDDVNNFDKTTKRRQTQFFDELTDPIAIVNSYDRGLYKPRVGWQFRYRVSRYIDSLRKNIREDQERLKLGLQAIKRKTPQEISGRRTRVLDKRIPTENEQSSKENKLNVGWRYRYRISKMLDAKKHGNFIDDEKEEEEEEEKRQIKSKSIQEEKDLDPELRQINEEGRRVGWAYRYRIRHKLDDLKKQQTKNGIKFDLKTLSNLNEKKIKSTEKKQQEIYSNEPKLDEKKKSVGWEYRYRISKMNDQQKRNKTKREKKPIEEQIPQQLSVEKRSVGWNYRYRIRRKLDSMQTAANDKTPSEKRMKKSSNKSKDKMIKKVEESIENILNIDDIDQTPFMEYFRRTSSYILSNLLPTAKRSICLLPLSIRISFCKQNLNNQLAEKTDKIKRKLKTKKEQRAKQFIRSHVTKLGADDKGTERRVDETMNNLYKIPSYPPLQMPPPPPSTSSNINEKKIKKKQRSHSSKESILNDKEDLNKKIIGVDSKKNKNMKQYQIVEKKIKSKDKSSVVEDLPKTTAAPRLRSISEVIQDEAATILVTRRPSSRTPEEIKDELNEANESVQERIKPKITTTTTTTMSVTRSDSKTLSKEDNTISNDNDKKTNRKNLKETGHNILDLDNDKRSS